MTAPVPTDLLIFNEASGTTVTNYGSSATNYTLTNGAGSVLDGTDMAWHQDAGSYDGYYEGIVGNTNHLTYATRTGTFTSTIQPILMACRFQIQALYTSGSAQCTLMGNGYGADDGHDERGGRIRCTVNGGGFDVEIAYRTTAFNQQVLLTLATGLSLNTDYSIAVAIMNTSAANYQIRAKLDAGTVATSSIVDLVSDSWTTLPKGFFKSDSTATDRGFDGYMYYAAYSRGAWSTTTATVDADLANINSAPKTYLVGWPGGQSVVPIMQNNYQG